MSETNWKGEIEKLLRDQMPYAFPIVELGKSFKQLEEGAFQEALGYVFDHIENLIEKKAFFDGYACGAGDAAKDNQLEFVEDLSRVGAERAWLKRNSDANT